VISKIIKLFLFLNIALFLSCGCVGILSVVKNENQKSEIAAANSTVITQGTELRLETSLKRTFHADGRTFDLNGQLTVVAVNGSMPQQIEAYHMMLKPGWKGWPDFYVLDITEQNGNWRMVNTGMNNQYSTFTGTSQKESGKILINFSWLDLGKQFGDKPKYFATYDVSVLLTDAQKGQYILANTNVPTD
jgi:hypothetical protein